MNRFAAITLSLFLTAGLVWKPEAKAMEQENPFKICGRLEQSRSNDLTFVAEIDERSGISIPASIYGQTDEITQQLKRLVGFRQICVVATAEESDIIVKKIISRIE